MKTFLFMSLTLTCSVKSRVTIAQRQISTSTLSKPLFKSAFDCDDLWPFVFLSNHLYALIFFYKYVLFPSLCHLFIMYYVLVLDSIYFLFSPYNVVMLYVCQSSAKLLKYILKMLFLITEKILP